MKKYSSGMVAESFWFVEFKKVVFLRHQGTSFEEIKILAIEEDLFGVGKVGRAIRMFGYLKMRVDAINDDLINEFVKADLQTQKNINLIAIAKKNRLFYEFLYEVYFDLFNIGNKKLTYSDVNTFFTNKQEQDEDVATWTDVTLKRLRSTYVNFLIDVSMITVVDKEWNITPLILTSSLKQILIDNGDKTLYKAISNL